MTDDAPPSASTTRRDVLKSSGALGGLELLGLGSRASETADDVAGPADVTHLVEVGQEISFVDDGDHSTILRRHFDSPPPYHVDADRGTVRVPLHSSLSETSRSRLAAVDVAVRTARPRPGHDDTVTAGGLAEQTVRVETVPRDLGSAYRFTDRSVLAGPLELRYPRVTRDGDAVRVERDGDRQRVELGTERSVAGAERTATFETRQVTDEPVDRPGLSDERAPLETDHGTIETTVVPVVRVRNLGPLTVRDRGSGERGRQ